MKWAYKGNPVVLFDNLKKTFKEKLSNTDIFYIEISSNKTYYTINNTSNVCGEQNKIFVDKSNWRIVDEKKKIITSHKLDEKTLENDMIELIKIIRQYSKCNIIFVCNFYTNKNSSRFRLNEFVKSFKTKEKKVYYYNP